MPSGVYDRALSRKPTRSCCPCGECRNCRKRINRHRRDAGLEPILKRTGRGGGMKQAVTDAELERRLIEKFAERGWDAAA